MDRQTPLWVVTYDFLFTGREFDSAMKVFSGLIIQYANYLHKETTAIVAGFYTDEDPDNAIVTISDLNNESKVEEGSIKLSEYLNTKIRIYVKLFVPVDEPFKKIKIYFNLHYRATEESGITSLYPATSLNDVSKIFFTIEEFTIWDQIVKS